MATVALAQSVMIALCVSMTAGTDCNEPKLWVSEEQTGRVVTALLPPATPVNGCWALYETTIKPSCIMDSGKLETQPTFLSWRSDAEKDNCVFFLVLSSSEDVPQTVLHASSQSRHERGILSQSFSSMLPVVFGSLLTLLATYIGPEVVRRGDALKRRMNEQTQVKKALQSGLSCLSRRWPDRDRTWRPDYLLTTKDEWDGGAGPNADESLRSGAIEFLNIYAEWHEGRETAALRSDLQRLEAQYAGKRR